VTAYGVFHLLEAAWELLPEVGELELVRARAGLRPGTPDNAPVVGPGELDGLIWATGHWRNGVLLAPLTGDAVAGLLAGEPLPEELAALAPDRFAGVRA
jgi:glycine oxidase